MNRKEINITKIIVIILTIVLAILLNSCTYEFDNKEISCDDKIEYWEDVLQAELYPGKRDNQKRIIKIEMIIQELKENCNE